MSEEEERELEDAEAAFRDEEAENNMQILTALGFIPHYHDKDKEGNDETNFGIQILNMKIGVKFNDKNPAGKVWAYVRTEDKKKDFIKNGDLKQLPLIQRYLDIQAGKKRIPEATAIGRIIERIGKGIKIEIEEDGKKKEIFFGLGAVKRHDDGHHFIPRGFSKPSSDNQEGKMLVPRDILLPDMDSQQREAEQKATQPAYPAEAETQRRREGQGRAPVATTIPIPTPATPPTVKENLTVPELIEKYLSIAVQVTKAVKENEEVSTQERGYVTNWVCNKVVDELVNGKGGSHEE